MVEAIVLYQIVLFKLFKQIKIEMKNRYCVVCNDGSFSFIYPKRKLIALFCAVNTLYIYKNNKV